MQMDPEVLDEVWNWSMDWDPEYEEVFHLAILRRCHLDLSKKSREDYQNTMINVMYILPKEEVADFLVALYP